MTNDLNTPLRHCAVAGLHQIATPTFIERTVTKTPRSRGTVSGCVSHCRRHALGEKPNKSGGTRFLSEPQDSLQTRTFGGGAAFSKKSSTEFIFRLGDKKIWLHSWQPLEVGDPSLNDQSPRRQSRNILGRNRGPTALRRCVTVAGEPFGHNLAGLRRGRQCGTKGISEGSASRCTPSTLYGSARPSQRLP